MEIKEKIEADLIQALKKKKEVEVLILRMMKSAIKNAEIAKRPQALTAEDIIKVLRSEIKKRQEAISDYKKGNRQDLADKESQEIEVIKRYLPPELADEELKKIIKKVIAKTKASGPKDFGKVMGMAMKEVAGRADGGKVSQVVKELLNNNQ